MEEVSVTREQLAETGAGKAVNEVAKCKSGTKPLRERAKALVAKWKEAVAKARAESDAGGGTRAMPNLPLQHGCPSLLAACEKPTDWAAVRKGLTVDMSVPEVDWCTPGSAAALVALDEFIKERLRIFAEKRNDPNVHASSDLSPYLHFGQLSAQRMALTVKKSGGKSEGIASFLEEAVVRRELSDNFVFYQPNYDSLDGAAGWARDSLELHAKDKREHVYTLEQLDKAQTHEDLWNAAQRQMVATGKMHGFMRMYWAKKILEWSPSPAEAHKRAIYLNDRYSLDGRDPNGYVGIGWAIMGTHDMGWTERAIFGKIRFMNYNGCKRKFDIARYVAKWGAKGPVVFPSSSSKKEDDNAPAAKKQKQ
uniref:Deoxyribodipyrimidine photo-lyase n=2 Tax=Chrysotila carterae TaxID=13221 RepID=A0A7S4ERN8_CHRCT